MIIESLKLLIVATNKVKSRPCLERKLLISLATIVAKTSTRSVPSVCLNSSTSILLIGRSLTLLKTD